MKLPMPEPQVSRDGTVTLHGAVAGDVGRDADGLWWARVDGSRRKLGQPFEAGGMVKRWQAVRWLIIQVVDWRAP